MSDFISDEEMQKLESSESPDFIPDESPWMPEQSFTPTSRTESLVRGGAQGLTSDFADEIAARIRSQMEDRSYEEVLPEERTKFKQAQASHPGYYGAAQVGGAVAPWLIPGGGAAGAAVRGSKWVAPVAAGALQGYGASEAETVGEALPDAAIGGIFGLGGATVGNLIGATPGAVRNLSSNRAAAQLGAERGTIKSLGADRVQQAGATALKEGILSTNTPLMQKRAGALNKSSGSRIGEINQMIDETGERYFSPESAAGELRKESGDFYESPLNRDIKNQYDNIIEAISGLGEDNIGVVKAQELKNQLKRAAKFDMGVRDDKALMAGEAYHVIRKHLDAAVTKGEQALGKTDVLADLYKQRKLYGDTKVMEKLLKNRYAREQGNKMGTSLTNTIVGSQAAQVAATGNIPAAAAMYGGKIGYERYGNIAMAHGADKIAKVLEYMPNKFGKYAPLMSQAIRQGPKAFAIQHFLMASRDPEYTKMVEQAVLEAEKEDEKKKQIAPIEPPSLGQQLGSAIDNFSWSDSIGLDPQERGEEGLYAEQVPQPASIKPFSFKKLFPSKSAVGSEIKQLPKNIRSGWDFRGDRATEPMADMLEERYRDVGEGVFGEGVKEKRLYTGELTPSEAVAARRLGKNIAPDASARTIARERGAVWPNPDDTPNVSIARDRIANIHEHTHDQMMNLNKIHPKAEEAVDEYLRLKAKKYGIPINVITTLMHGPKEFMTISGDILQDKKTREAYFGHLDNKNEIVQKLRRFYTDAATEVQNMDEQDIMRLIEEYNERWKDFSSFVKNKRELGDFR